ncbi:threonine synthase, partial [Lactobacillus nasalidis]
MIYRSTRSHGHEVTAAQAIVQGLAPDGGLFVPKEFPAAFTPAGLQELFALPYQELAKSILERFLPDYSSQQLEAIVQGAYGSQWDDDRITPLTTEKAGSHYLELFHGPTLAFKDVALQCLPRLMKTALANSADQRGIVILTATSGDTGTAAMRGFQALEKTRVIVFYPYQGVAPIQLKQMLSENSANTVAVAVEGNFDQAQSRVKQIFNDPDMNSLLAQHDLTFSSANSMNIGRLLPQVVYYFAAYGQLLDQGAIKPGDPVNFSVPTGNFGDILAGYYAKKLGLPVGRLICASNKNNVLTDFFKTGKYDKKRDFYVTNSPSMDILVSSNLERLLFDLCQDPDLVKSLMEQLTSKGEYQLPEEMRAKLDGFWADYATPEEIEGEIKRVHQESGYVIDPHTAVASLAAKHFKEQVAAPGPTVVLSTASPFKFPETVYHAISGQAVKEKGLPALKQLTDLVGSLPPAMEAFLGRSSQ